MNAPTGTTLTSTTHAEGPESAPFKLNRNGKVYTARTVYDFYGGKWEGFVTMREVK